MRFLAVIGALAILAVLGASAYFFTGAYDVAATAEEPALIGSMIAKVRGASVRHHATGKPPFAENDKTAIQQGAKAFAQAGCVNCHGGIGVDWQKFAEGMNPSPPDLKDAAQAPIGHIVWVVKNGIRMTGMPSFEKAGLKDDQIWQIAAFVKAWPTVKEDDYKAWTAGSAATGAGAGK